MEIEYKNRQICRICEDMAAAQKKHGLRMAEKINQRIGEIRAADSVEQMIKFGIGDCHPLHQDRRGQYAVSLVQPYRLIFEQKDSKIQIVTINEIVNYH